MAQTSTVRSVSGLWVMARWSAAGALGFALGIAGGAALTELAQSLAGVNPDRFSAYAILCSLGVAVGLLQWKTIVQWLPELERWAPATLAGYVLAMIPLTAPRLLGASGAPLLLIMGGLMALGQWWLLRQHYRGAAIWVVASAAGMLSFLWLIANPASSLLELMLAGAVLGGLAAVLPGAALVWLARRPHV